MRTCEFIDVGRLEFDGRLFAFSTQMRQVETYRASELFDFFADRMLLAASKAGYDHLRTVLGLTRGGATAVELLARSWGSTQHDRIQVVPDLVEREDHVSVLPFLVSGARHVDEDDPERLGALIASLHEGKELQPPG